MRTSKRMSAVMKSRSRFYFKWRSKVIQRQIFEYNDVLGYRFIPNIKARIQHESGGYLLRTNDCGFRCEHDFFVQKKTQANLGILRAHSRQ